MLQFSKLPLNQKLILAGLSTTAAAMLLAGCLMFISEYLTFRRASVRDLSIKAEIIGNQCAAALLFDVPQDAGETLASLQADPDIDHAVVYTANNTVFARYQRPGTDSLRMPMDMSEGYRFGINTLTVSSRIQVKNRVIGSALIQSNLKKLQAIILRYVISAVLVLVVSMLVAYVLVARLQRIITRPVMDLVWMMQHISQDQDFSVRANETSRDELGILALGFNEMLGMIQKRDLELDVQRQELERIVLSLERSTEELEEANRKLKELDKLKSDFISTASHELRTPLTSIKANVDMLVAKPDFPNESRKKVLEIVNSETDRLIRLVSDLLDLSRIESGTMMWRMSDVSLEDVVRSAMAGIEPIARKKKLQITMDIRSAIPLVRGDRDRLMQVMTNILANAVKFTPKGGSIGVSVLHEARAAEQLLVSVTDTGRGIPQEELKTVFERFRRSQEYGQGISEGSGLGLAIAREIIGFHRGTIWAENKSEGGSAIFFTLPLHNRDAADDPSRS